jgi:hypothetical protein
MQLIINEDVCLDLYTKKSTIKQKSHAVFMIFGAFLHTDKSTKKKSPRHQYGCCCLLAGQLFAV